MPYAITPRGVGIRAGARRIRDGWPLSAGETFTVAEDYYTDSMVLAEDGKSLREPRADEVISVLDSMAFFSRLTDDEYEALTKTKSVKLLRWLERVRTRGYIEVNGRTMKEAKEELSAAGVSASRVAELFAR